MISEVKEVFALWGIVFAVLRITADQEPDAVGPLEVAQGDVSLSSDSQDWRLLPDGGSDLPLSLNLTKEARRTGSGRRTYTYLAHFVEPDGASQINDRLPVQVTLYDEQGHATRSVINPGHFTPQRLAKTDLGEAVLEIVREAGPAEIASALLSLVQVESIEALGPSFIDRAVAGASGLVLDGWIAGLGDRDVHVVTGDLRAFVPKAHWALRRRLDVHEHLANSGAFRSATDTHGFAAVFPAEAEDSVRELFFVECDPARDRTTFYGPVKTNPRRNNQEALDIVRHSFGDIQSLPKDLVSQVYRPFLAIPKSEAFAKPFRFGPAVRKGEPLASIIIPFYGDAFFLNCVYHLLRVLGPGFELVLVVDDPRIWPEIYSRLASRSKSITVPTLLLQNAENYGYGRANNLGFMAASGDVVFLMNSDIMVTDPAPLHEAAEAIRARQEEGEPDLVVGFSLLYEDNTIQHIGMEFPQSTLVGGMHLADHPMKGLPFGLYRGETIRSAPAVTAALMALSSDLFSRLGGFDTVYERGDFEDADLCLRAEQLGAEMQVFVRPGLYHLERQSIPSMGDGDLRQMVTYMNCVSFNQRWQTRLAPPEPEAKPVRRIQVKKRAAVGA
ncbi:glycosyltransferase [Microvirga sp. BT689]|uniref:glycosyltransferase family 2 protein n=1 Tax=Microvirga arvi TaxID=2778731 RepID=UPI00194F5ACC|nr:glycosyltransferase [Microvirga arvi]MBM6582753.1 glycosyltransferase [Microvirga arvi]